MMDSGPFTAKKWTRGNSAVPALVCHMTSGPNWIPGGEGRSQREEEEAKTCSISWDAGCIVGRAIFFQAIRISPQMQSPEVQGVLNGSLTASV